MRRTLRLLVVGGMLATATVGLTTSAPADGHITQVATGLENPRGLTFDTTGNLYVAESGVGGNGSCVVGPEGHDSCYGETGGIAKITDLTGADAANAASRIVDNLPSHAVQEDNPETAEINEAGSEGLGPADVSVGEDGLLYYTVGLGADPAIRQNAEDGFSEAGSANFATVWRAGTDGSSPEMLADLGTYETDNNPDDGLPGMGFLDANPFGLVADTANSMVHFVDSGGNYQGAIDLSDGNAISTTQVFPPSFVPAPPFLGAPSGTLIPAQPVPTQLTANATSGHDVGLLTGFPFYPGASTVYHTESDSMSPVAAGFTNVMDLAWGPDGNLYVLEISHDGLIAGFTGALIRMDPETGKRDLLLAGPDLLAPGGIAFNPIDGMAYITRRSPLADGDVIKFDAVAATPLVSVTDDTATTSEDEPISVDVSANDDEDTTVTAVFNNSAGAAWPGSVEYQPKAHFTGTDVVTYQACDADANCLIGTVTVTVSENTVDRIDGIGRIQTAIEASRAVLPDGAPAVVLARGDIYPDALTGSVLAKQVGGPILLNDREGLNDEVAAEINRLGATTAYILGGVNSQDEDLEQLLTDNTTVTTATRVAGNDRFETAVAIKDKVEELSGSAATAAYVTEGADPNPERGWPDAVAVSALAAHEGKPILLVTTDEYPTSTAGAVTGLDAVTIIGGPNSVSTSVADAIDEDAGTVDRMGGISRYETSLMVANASKAAGLDASKLWLASGGKFPDALVIGPLVAMDGGVMMLVAPDDLSDSPDTKDFIEANGPYTDVDLAGGPNTISTTVEAQVALARAAS